MESLLFYIFYHKSQGLSAVYPRYRLKVFAYGKMTEKIWCRRVEFIDYFGKPLMLEKFRHWVNTYQSSVARQMMGWIFVSSLIMTILVSSIQLYLNFRESFDDLDRNLQEIEDTILPSLTRSIWLMDQEQIRVALKGLLLYDKIEYVKIITEDNLIFVEGESLVDSFVEKKFELNFVNQGRQWLLGALSIQLNLESVYKNLWKVGRDIFLNNLLLVVTIVTILLWITRRLVTQPLSVLAKRAEGIRFRDKQAYIDPKYLNLKDEIGQVFLAVAKLEKNLTEDYRIRVATEEALKESQAKLKKLIKSKTKELDETTKDLVDSSRKAGMAEVATGVLHNIGNVLTGINISVHELQDRCKKSGVHRLPDLVELFRDREENLNQFMDNSDKRHQIVSYLEAVISGINSQRNEDLKAVNSVSRNIKHIMRLVSQQQDNARHTGIINNFSTTGSIIDVLELKSPDLQLHNIKVEFESVDDFPVSSDKHKFLQIITNLIANAIQALQLKVGEKIIKIKQRHEGSFVIIEIQDNGVGISEKHLQKIFQFGFTTKPDGNGFGLHSSAIDATTLGGKLSVYSDGVNRGALFMLKIPLDFKKNKERA